MMAVRLFGAKGGMAQFERMESHWEHSMRLEGWSRWQ